MNVLFVSLDKGMFEDSPVLERQKEYAAKLGSVTVIVLTKRGFSKKVHKNLTIIPTNSHSYINAVFDAVSIAKKMEGIELISSQDPFACGIAGVFIKKKLKVPLNVQVHTDITSKYWKKTNRLFSVFTKWVLPRADSIRSVNKNVYNFVREKYPGTKACLVPIATDFEKWPERNSYDTSFKVVSVARLVPVKNFALLLHAMAIVHDKQPNVKFFIAGSGPQEGKLKSLTVSLQLNDVVSFIGNQPQEKIRDLFADSDASILPSWYEGWGLSAVESLAVGTPVIMTDTGCAGTAVIDGKTGIIVSQNDEQELADAILRLIEDSALRKSLGKKGAKLVREKFSREKLIKSWVDCLRQGI